MTDGLNVPAGLKQIHVESPVGQQLGRIYELAKDIRGSFMEQAILIDLLIADILTHFFAPDKQRRMLLSSEVFSGSGSSFNKNILILKKVVTLCYGDFAKLAPDLFPLLEKIRIFRNKLAHASVDTSDEFIARGYNDRVRFISFKDGVAKVEEITVQERNKRLGECTAAMMKLLELQALVHAELTTT